MTRKRRLGKTDIELSPIGLGTWQFSQGGGLAGKFWASIDQDMTAAVVKAALEGGISWFDTAEAYGRGNSERSLAAALAVLGVKPGSVSVATKWWPLARTAASIGRTLGERLGALAPYPIDLHQVHQPISLSTVRAQMNAMADLVAEGKVRAVGVSNFSARAMEEAHAALAARGIPLASNQVRVSLLDRAVEANGVLDAARRLGVTLIAYSPLAQGILSGRFHGGGGTTGGLPWMRRMMSGLGPRAVERTALLVAELEAIAAAHGASPSQVALAWLIQFYGETLVAIPGASRPAQASQAASAMDLALGRVEVERLDSLSRALAGRR